MDGQPSTDFRQPERTARLGPNAVTRVRKRLYSAHMLNYAFRTFRDDIKKGGKVDVEDLVRLFAAWNANVDSAFSRVVFQKRAKNLILRGADHHVAVEDPPEAQDA